MKLRKTYEFAMSVLNSISANSLQAEVQGSNPSAPTRKENKKACQK
jgi:hypothetical protein